MGTNTVEQPVTVVALDDELRRLGPRLQDALGPSYRVLVGPPGTEAEAAVVPACVSRIELMRAERPDVFIVVYDNGPNEPGLYLDVDADDYVAAASMAEVAARIRAGLRRLGWQRARR